MNATNLRELIRIMCIYEPYYENCKRRLTHTHTHTRTHARTHARTQSRISFLLP